VPGWALATKEIDAAFSHSFFEPWAERSFDLAAFFRRFHWLPARGNVDIGINPDIGRRLRSPEIKNVLSGSTPTHRITL